MRVEWNIHYIKRLIFKRKCVFMQYEFANNKTTRS